MVSIALLAQWKRERVTLLKKLQLQCRSLAPSYSSSISPFSIIVVFFSSHDCERETFFLCRNFTALIMIGTRTINPASKIKVVDAGLLKRMSREPPDI